MLFILIIAQSSCNFCMNLWKLDFAQNLYKPMKLGKFVMHLALNCFGRTPTWSDHHQVESHHHLVQNQSGLASLFHEGLQRVCDVHNIFMHIRLESLVDFSSFCLWGFINFFFSAFYGPFATFAFGRRFQRTINGWVSLLESLLEKNKSTWSCIS